ncbi:NAD-dependent epimerase/dehydratase family protein [Paenibacillus sp. YPG26]|uniref:NAD-dependent epimerase/dehydratase family protein n=1 Tax=Paenibacillus sp. YPG26 TaxID=2878915 RepID=UPI00203C8FDD|nr:NAD-dependent epimerase/dehydratase family protein [Paenibacillus sp. YPG26]USB32476.1 SDR family NAD(P)-dependent oxidoreductase [Paenibacillus sp. YPG26]
MSQINVLITGAAGFTGRHACRYFVAKGYHVAAAVRNAAKYSEPGVEYISCDLTRREQVRELVKRVKPRYVLHLGGKNSVPESWGEPLLYMESNIMGSLYLLQALRESGCSSRILVAGSRLKFALSGPLAPTHPYALSKSVQEVTALSWGKLFHQDVLVAEPGNLIGPGPSTGICALLAKYIVNEEQGEEQKPFHLSSAEERRDFLDVRDAVAAYEVLLRHGETGSVTPVCSGLERTLGEVAQLYASLSTANIAIEAGDAPASGAEEAVQPVRLRELGWEPKYTWEMSLRDILEYYRAERAEWL